MARISDTISACDYGHPAKELRYSQIGDDAFKVGPCPKCGRWWVMKGDCSEVLSKSGHSFDQSLEWGMRQS